MLTATALKGVAAGVAAGCAGSLGGVMDAGPGR
jgi:hypothetical protein